MICINILLSRQMQCWPPGRKFPCSLRERYKFQTLFRNFPILILFEMILWTRGMQWLQPHRRGFDGRAKNFLSVYKNVKKHINRKIDLHKNPIVSVNVVLTTPLKFSFQSPRMIKNLYFFRKIQFLFFLNTFRWTRRMQWLQLRRRLFDERPKVFRSKYKNGKKH